MSRLAVDARFERPATMLLCLLLAAMSTAVGILAKVDHVDPARGSSAPIGPLFGPHSVAQRFPAAPGSLVGIQVRLATYARSNAGTIDFELRDGQSGQSLRSDSAAAGSISDNSEHEFRFDPLQVSPDSSGVRMLTFSLQNSAETDANAITVWTTARAADPDATDSYDGVPGGADLVYQPIYEETLGGALLAQVAQSAARPLGPLAALALLFLPGFAIGSFLLPPHTAVGQRIAAAPAFSIACTALLVLYATTVGLRVDATVAWVWLLICCLLVALSSWRRPRSLARAPDVRRKASLDWPLLAALLATLAGIGMRALVLADSALPPGADAYQHAVITQLIMDSGQLPASYEPFAPIQSFAYHFGFHAFTALVGLASGLAVLDALRLVAPLITTAASLSVFFLVRSSNLGNIAAVTAAAVTALVSPFPAGFLTVGRYPEAAGTVILPVAIALVLRLSAVNQSEQPCRREIVGLALLAGGLFLTHYRVAIFLAAIGIVVLAINVARLTASQPLRGLAVVRIPLVRLTASLTIVVLLGLPWIARLAQSFSFGLPGSSGRYGPAYYSLDRLGPLPEPSSVLLALVAVGGVALALVRYQSTLIALAVWSLLLLAYSNPYWLPLPFAGAADSVTVVMSLFVAASLGVGYLAQVGYDAMVRAAPRHATRATIIALAAVSLWGMAQLPALRSTEDNLATASDLSAAGWLAGHRSPGGTILINASVEHWEPDFVVPTDAGYWLPLLTRRETTLLPILYPGERGISRQQVDGIERIVSAEAGDMGNPHTLALLREAGVSNVFIGATGGSIDERSIIGSAAYRRMYAAGGTSIYELVPEGDLVDENRAEGDR